MEDSVAQKVRNRRSVSQLLAAYEADLADFDAKVAKQRARKVERIERLSNRHALIALAHETLNGMSPEEVQAQLDAQLEDLKLRRKAVRKLAKSA